MKRFKAIFLSVFAAILTTTVVSFIYIQYERNAIEKVYDRYFFESDCIWAVYYTTSYIGPDGVNEIIQLKRLNDLSFRVFKMKIF
jgi:hypothetical protein